MTIDILPTVAHLLETNLPNHPIDGKNIWPLMAGEAGARSPQEGYYLYWGNELQAIRSGPWKLHFPHPYRSLNGRPGGRDGMPARYEQAQIELALFNLESDPGESKNVAADHLDVMERLSKLAEVARKDLGDGEMRGAGVRPVGKLAK